MNKIKTIFLKLASHCAIFIKTIKILIEQILKVHQTDRMFNSIINFNQAFCNGFVSLNFLHFKIFPSYFYTTAIMYL